VDGRPVFPNFSRTKHVSTGVLAPIMFQPIIVGCDTSGITPAAVVLQNQQGKWCVLDEIFADGEGLETFLQGLLLPLLRSKYPTNPVSAALDPSNPRDSAYAVTPKQRFEDAGITASVNFSNSPKVRIAAVDSLLNKDQGGLIICPSCDLTIRAFSHEYRYRRLRASGTFSQAFTPQPEKNTASHIADAVQYAALAILQGMGYDDGKSYEIVQRISQQRAVLSRIL
jgi:hypothetical protein